MSKDAHGLTVAIWNVVPKVGSVMSLYLKLMELFFSVTAPKIISAAAVSPTCHFSGCMVHHERMMEAVFLTIDILIRLIFTYGIALLYALGKVVYRILHASSFIITVRQGRNKLI